MKINVVIGNPPYNNDLYIPFVEKGHQMADKCSVWITPAKWQAKGGERNEQFRKNIVPYMSKIVYYPDCTDIFGIADPAGLTYYLLHKGQEFNIKIIKNVSIKHQNLDKNKNNYMLFNDEETRKLNNCLNNIGNKIVSKIFELGNHQVFMPEAMAKDKNYQCWCANKVSRVSQPPYSNLWNSEDCTFLCLGTIDIVDNENKKILTETARGSIADDSRLIASFDSVDECNSFRSWAYCRLTRFLLFLSLCGLTGIATNNEWWRFVPDPGAFDHIFTDEELYKKYNLSEEEINIIESVIKERK